jgi:acyl carrier protein
LIKNWDLNQLKAEIKQKLLIERLDLEDITADEITDDLILFNDGLGLDSVEAFEIMVGLEEMYGVSFEGIPAEEIRQHLKNVESIAALVYTQCVRSSTA